MRTRTNQHTPPSWNGRKNNSKRIRVWTRCASVYFYWFHDNTIYVVVYFVYKINDNHVNRNRVFNCTHYGAIEIITAQYLYNEKYLFMSFYWMCISAKSLTHSFIQNHSLQSQFNMYVLCVCINKFYLVCMSVLAHVKLANNFISFYFPVESILFLLCCYCFLLSFYFAPTAATATTITVIEVVPRLLCLCLYVAGVIWYTNRKWDTLPLTWMCLWLHSHQNL